jgi:hypothetical protein
LKWLEKDEKNQPNKQTREEYLFDLSFFFGYIVLRHHMWIVEKEGSLFGVLPKNVEKKPHQNTSLYCEIFGYNSV